MLLVRLRASRLARLSTPSRHATRPSPARAMASSGSDAKLDKTTTPEQWKKLLSAEEFYVLRQKGTEPPGSGRYNKHAEAGTYTCAGCGTPLFTSDMKFDSGCGWPAFWDEIPGTVVRTPEADGRVEITCAKCDGHLGHVFANEGFPNPKPIRHCVNSISIKFEPK